MRSEGDIELRSPAFLSGSVRSSRSGCVSVLLACLVPGSSRGWLIKGPRRRSKIALGLSRDGKSGCIALERFRGGISAALEYSSSRPFDKFGEDFFIVEIRGARYGVVWWVFFR